MLEWEGSASSRMSSMKSIKCKFHEFFWLILFSEESWQTKRDRQKKAQRQKTHMLRWRFFGAQKDEDSTCVLRVLISFSEESFTAEARRDKDKTRQRQDTRSLLFDLILEMITTDKADTQLNTRRESARQEKITQHIRQDKTRTQDKTARHKTRP